MHPQTTPRIRVPAPLHAPLSTRLLEISLSLAVSKRSIFWPVWPPGAPRGPLQPSQIQKIVGAGAFPPLPPPPRRCATGAPLRGARAGLRPTRSPTAISKPNPNPTAISTKNADFVYLCRCAPPDLRVVVRPDDFVDGLYRPGRVCSNHIAMIRILDGVGFGFQGCPYSGARRNPRWLPT